MTKKPWILGLLLAGAMVVTASTPVAMRVELEPLRQVGALTEVAVVVQVSPEDRIRIGSNAILRIELDGGTVSSGSPMRAVRLEDDGSARVVVEWPPGEHHLRVEIEDPNREDTGLWVGTVRIPDLSPGTAIKQVSEAEPVPAPVPEISEPETPPPPDADDAIDASLAAAAASTPDVIPSAEPASEPAPAVQELEDAEAIAETTPESPASDPPPMVAPAAVGAAAVSEIPVPVTEEIPAGSQKAEPDPVAVAESAASEPLHEAPEPVAIDIPVEIEGVEPEPVEVVESASEEPPVEESAPLIEQPENDEVVSDAERDLATVEDEAELPQIENPPKVVEEPPLVEPLRADPPPQTTEPTGVGGHQQVESAPGSVPVSADLAGRYQEWGNTDSNTREFSIILLRGREPATGIDIADLRLRVGGSEVPVERLGDVGSAPLLLGLAIDVVPDGIDGWPGMQGSLAPIVERAGDGRGRLFVASPSGVGGWDAEPALSDRIGGSNAPMNITQLVVASLERFEGQRGRTFLVVLTDGRDEPSKDEWQQATDHAGAAGVPILVVALWDDDFNNRSRKNLKKLTEVSGGSLFLVQGRAQLESAADRFGRYLDGGYSVRFSFPGGDRQTVTTISVSASDKEVDVSAPKTIR